MIDECSCELCGSNLFVEEILISIDNGEDDSLHESCHVCLMCFSIETTDDPQCAKVMILKKIRSAMLESLDDDQQEL